MDANSSYEKGPEIIYGHNHIIFGQNHITFGQTLHQHFRTYHGNKYY